MSDLKAFEGRLDIITIAEACTKVERFGKGGRILCPVHDESNPSCYLEPLINSWSCWSCGAKGDTLKLVMLLRKLSLPEAVAWISETFGVEPPPRYLGAETRPA